MSLDWNLSKIKNNKEVCWKNGLMKAETHELIYSTIAVGMGEITEKNWREFLSRLNCWEMVHGFNRTKPETVRDHIGLRTNVFPKESRTKFALKILAQLEKSECLRRAAEAMEIVEHVATDGAEITPELVAAAKDILSPSRPATGDAHPPRSSATH